MERKDALALAKELGISAPHKMKSADLMEAIKIAQENQAETEAESTKEPDVEKSTTKDKPKKVVKKAVPRHKLSSGEKLKLLKADLLRKERVTVMDLQRQYLTDDGESPAVRVSFRVGQVSEAKLVQTDQQPQMLSRGIIQVLKDMTIDTTAQIPGKFSEDSIVPGVSKRFIVTHVPGMTEEEIEAQKAREKARAK